MIDRRSLIGVAAALAVSPATAQSSVVEPPCGPVCGLVVWLGARAPHAVKEQVRRLELSVWA